MSRVAGFTVLMLGLGFGGYVYYPELAQYDADARNAAARLVKEDPLLVPASAPRETRTFSPQTPLFAPVAAPVPPVPVKAVRPTAPVPVAVATVQATTEADAGQEHAAAGESTAWAATVTHASGDGGVPRLSSKPRDDVSREKLSRELQQELKRVGCYQGEVDGQWGAGSRRAMTAFTERVNATLPVEEPDYILLTLVQGHQAAACGKACPAGQVMSSDRCVPQAVLAQAERKAKRTAKAPADTGRGAQPPAITRTAEVERQPIREPRRADDALPGRMSIGGPAVPVLKSEPRRATPPPSRMADARPEPGVSSSGGVVPASPVPVTGRATSAPIPVAPAAREAQSVERYSRPARAPVRHETRMVRHAPEPRYVQRPRPSASSRSKRMIYDLFQRPDRVY